MSTLILLMLTLLGVIGTQAVEWLPNIIQPFNLLFITANKLPLPPHALMNESPLLLV